LGKANGSGPQGIAGDAQRDPLGIVGDAQRDPLGIARDV
jgi:hypothetical protein